MPNKKDNQKSGRYISKREMTHFEMEKRRSSIIFLVGIIVIVASIILTGLGWYTTAYQPYHETVISVNGANFSMQYFIDDLSNYKNFVATYGNQMSGLQQQIAQTVISQIEQQALAKKAAADLGFTISKSDIDNEIKAQKLPNNAVNRDNVEANLLSKKLLADYFDSKVPKTAPQRQVQAMLLESEQQANDIRARLEKGEDFGTIAAELSLNQTTKDNKGDMGWHPQDVLEQLIGKVPADYAFGSDAGTLSQPRQDTDVTRQLGYWLIKVTSINDAKTEAKVLGILVGSQAEAITVKARLDKGEDFATVAKEVSQASSAADNGGDLGTLTKGTKPVFDAVIFEGSGLAANKVSDPIKDTTVQTRGGYWLVKVQAVESDRQLSDTDRNSLKSKALNDWASGLFLDTNNKIDTSALTPDKIAFATGKAFGTK